MQNAKLIEKDVAKALVSKWKKVLDFSSNTVAPIEESHKRLSTAMLLENESRYLTEEGLLAQQGGVFGNNYQPTAGTFSGDRYAPGDARLPKVLIPMIRRTFPELITNEIVGVQPMSGPVGLAFALRYTYDPEPLDGWASNDRAYKDADPFFGPKDGDAWWYHKKGDPGHQVVPSGDIDEAGYNRLFTDYTGMSTSAFDEINKEGLSASQIEAVSALINAQDKGVARLLAQFEMTGKIPQMSIKIEKTAVEAGTRRIAANWSTELEQDLKAMNGITIDNEMTNTLSYEIQAEIDREMLTRMIHICLKTGFSNPSKGKGFSFWDCGQADGRWFGERCRDFYARLIVEANRIAINSRRGPANFIIATPRVCAMLEQLPDFKVMTATSSVNTAQTGVAKVGTVGGRFTLYRDTRTEAQYDMGDRENAVEYALLGYKGAEFYDTGIVFCPYIPVMIQRAIQPNTFNPRIGLMTRYGVVDHIFGSEIFYHLIVVTGLGEQMDSLYSNTGRKTVFL